jgi:hypothetical protein
MLSKRVRVYPRQLEYNFGSVRKYVFRHNGKPPDLLASLWRFFLRKFYLPDFIRINFFRRTFRRLFIGKFQRRMLKEVQHENNNEKDEGQSNRIDLGIDFSCRGLYAADQFEGTWKLNESKSKLTPGTDKGTKIVYNSRVIGDELTVTTDGIEGDRTPIHSEWKGKFDGKDYAITGDPDANMCSYQKINDRTLSMTTKKGAEVVLQGLIIVAVDGKSQDVFLTSPDAVMSVYNAKAREKGNEKGFRNKAVYDKA